MYQEKIKSTFFPKNFKEVVHLHKAIYFEASIKNRHIASDNEGKKKFNMTFFYSKFTLKKRIWGDNSGQKQFECTIL